MASFRVAVDIGGTFVDAVAVNPLAGETRIAKALTTPEDPTNGVLAAIEKLGVEFTDIDIFVHGTTLGLNAIIERRGSKVGLVVNEGFRDIFQIGRGALPPKDMYNIRYEPPAPLVPRRAIVGATGRIDAGGDLVRDLDEGALVETTRDLIEREGIEAIAVSFLYSFIDPEHEQRAADILRREFPGLVVSTGSSITREHREYERTCTVVLEAYIRPIFERYLGRLHEALGAKGFDGVFLTMRSSGGAMTIDAAKSAPLHSVLSGPAGGIIGSKNLAQTLDRPYVLTLDYGGTSLDACVIKNGEPDIVHETELDIYPALIPVFDIRCIGAGGGSIAWHDEGLLKLGPHSAGAVPGPIAYGRGGEQPTTTDAAVVLGYLHPGGFSDGEISLDVDAAERGLSDMIGAPLGLTALQSAVGVFNVIAAQTVTALRQITVERGMDPKDFSIVGFGGAGPMIAPLISIEMGIAEVIIPPLPSVFSAWGMILSDITTDISRTLIADLDDTSLARARGVLLEMENEITERLQAQQVAKDQMRLTPSLDIRYSGQSHTLNVPIAADSTVQNLAAAFHARHQERYGHHIDETLEIVNLRILGEGVLEKPAKSAPPDSQEGVTPVPYEMRRAYCFVLGSVTEFFVYKRSELCAGAMVDGPAIFEDGTSSTITFTGQTISVDADNNLIIRNAR